MEMRDPVPSRRLSGVDAAFLYLERKELPLSIAGVFIFDGPIPFEKFVADVESKLDLIPRYRQIVVAPPLNIGYPMWEDASHFDIRQHIVRERVRAPGGEEQLEALAGRILTLTLDRSRPLWQIHIIEGLSGGRGAMIVRMHHALADGIAGIEILSVLFDSTPEGSKTRKPVEAPPSRPAQASLGKAVINAVHNTFSKLIGAEENILDFVQALPTERMRTGLAGVACLLPELMTAVERLPFNRPCSGERKFCWMEADFEDVQAIRKAAGGTVNDVALSVITRGIARYVEAHGGTTTNRLVRIIVPVNLRQDNGESMGNKISFMPVVLPLDITDPVPMLQATARRMEIMKRAKAGEALELLGNVLGAAPPPLQWMFWRGIAEVSLPLPLFNIICTNVPGVREPLYCLGRQLVAVYPQVPTGYELGFGCAVLSYAGKLFFGFLSDAKVAPDVRRLRDFVREAFNELRHAVAAEGPPEEEPAPKAKPRRRAAAKKPVRKRAAAEPEAVEPGVEAAAAPEPVIAETTSAEPVAAATPRRRRTKTAAPAAPEPAPVMAETMSAEPVAAATPRRRRTKTAAPAAPEPEPVIAETAPAESAAAEPGQPEAAAKSRRRRTKAAPPAAPEPAPVIAETAPVEPVGAEAAAEPEAAVAGVGSIQ